MKTSVAVLLLGLCVLTASLTACAPSEPGGGEGGSQMQRICFHVDGQTVEAELYDNAAARDLLSRLPLTLEFSDYNNTEKIACLPGEDLDTAGVPSAFDPSVGDITVYAPWGNLAIFYRDFGNSPGLVPIGRLLNDGIEVFAAMNGSFSVTISSSASAE